MPRVGFEPTTQVFETAKTAHALDREATGIGWVYYATQLLFTALHNSELQVRIMLCTVCTLHEYL
jgi:hypothetical protein